MGHPSLPTRTSSLSAHVSSVLRTIYMKGQGGQPDIQCPVTISPVPVRPPPHPHSQHQAHPASVPLSCSSPARGTLPPSGPSSSPIPRCLLSNPAHPGGPSQYGQTHTSAPLSHDLESFTDGYPLRLNRPASLPNTGQLTQWQHEPAETLPPSSPRAFPTALLSQGSYKPIDADLLPASTMRDRASH